MAPETSVSDISEWVPLHGCLTNTSDDVRIRETIEVGYFESLRHDHLELDLTNREASLGGAPVVESMTKVEPGGRREGIPQGLWST